MNVLPPALQALAGYKQFILWERIPRTGGKVDKVPVDPSTRRPTNAHGQAAQLDAVTALQLAGELGEPYGVGFVFTSQDPFFFIDIDSCADPSSSNGWGARANELMTQFRGAAIEVSQSGRGLHIIAKGQAPAGHAIKGEGFDLFTEKRFCALTGIGCVGSAATEHTATLHTVCAQRMPEIKTSVDIADWTTEPVGEYTGAFNDDELIAQARRSRSASAAFGSAVSFEALWTADVDALGARWPDPQREYDASSADAALAQHLAFWTGKDCERIDRIMRQSELVRDKWDRADYMQRTIIKAVALQTTVYTGGSVAAEQIQPIVDSEGVITPVKEGYQLMPLTQQTEHFKNCIYVQSVHRVYTPEGLLLKPDQFRATYGGYVFVLDSINNKVTKNAWEAFTESQALTHPKVHDMRFRPQEEPGAIIEAEGLKYLNTWRPIQTDRTPGDVEPFLHHVKLLLPDRGDREILLSYLAACIQYPGVKFQWCILLQGMPGNGKSLFFRILTHALGERYSHQLDPRDIDSLFNSWIEGKLIIGVEEIRIAGSYAMTDTLKPLITNERVPVQAKGIDQRTGDNCANFFMTSNYKDAVTKTLLDRRYSVLYSAQQCLEDFHTAGMTDRYFRIMYDYFRSGGYAHTSHYLSQYPVAVDVLGRAPRTTSTDEAIVESYGAAEQIVLEAIELERPGFRGGLVSASFTSQLLASEGRKLGPKAVANVLRSIGFEKHPALLRASRGRITIDGIRHNIYIDKAKINQTETSDEVVSRWKLLQEKGLE